MPRVHAGGRVVSGNMVVRELDKNMSCKPHQVGVEAAQSNVPLYRLAEKYDITWHTNSTELAGAVLGHSPLTPAQTLT